MVEFKGSDVTCRRSRCSGKGYLGYTDHVSLYPHDIEPRAELLASLAILAGR